MKIHLKSFNKIDSIVSFSCSNWWPLIVVLFYIFSVIPTFMSRRIAQNTYSAGANSCQEVSIFITMGFIISAFALPIVLAHSGVVSNEASFNNSPILQVICFIFHLKFELFVYFYQQLI